MHNTVRISFICSFPDDFLLFLLLIKQNDHGNKMNDLTTNYNKISVGMVQEKRFGLDVISKNYTQTLTYKVWKKIQN